ncbi:hypothetical protein [Streptomyces sp. CRN 30]|uniref:hypothetical protein n=1 Tax=Streptomyces sp. CRN 30 TaxID=3075613 RepID=UPI002A812B7A|nr:hypothetical protein [Streptomyces sp. CRN 30]
MPQALEALGSWAVGMDARSGGSSAGWSFDWSLDWSLSRLFGQLFGRSLSLVFG